MLSWFTTDSRPSLKAGEIPQLSRSLGVFTLLNFSIHIVDPIKEDDEVDLPEITTDTTTSASSSLIGSITGYWSSTTPSSPSKRLSITRQKSIVIDQSGEFYSDLSQVPTGVDVEYVEEKQEQSGLWDFFNHVVNGDEDENPDTIVATESIAPDDTAHNQTSETAVVVEVEHILQESPRRRNSVGGQGKSMPENMEAATEHAECSTPVQEAISGGDRTPIVQDQPPTISITSNRERCILCGRNCMTVHSSSSRSRSV